MNSLTHICIADTALAGARSASDRFRPVVGAPVVARARMQSCGEASIRGGVYSIPAVSPNLFGTTNHAFWAHTATTVKCHSQRRKRF